MGWLAASLIFAIGWSGGGGGGGGGGGELDGVEEADVAVGLPRQQLVARQPSPSNLPEPVPGSEVGFPCERGLLVERVCQDFDNVLVMNIASENLQQLPVGVW